MHRSHHSVIIVFFQCTQACQPGWCVDWRIILERVKEKRKEEVKEETRGERRRKRERERWKGEREFNEDSKDASHERIRSRDLRRINDRLRGLSQEQGRGGAVKKEKKRVTEATSCAKTDRMNPRPALENAIPSPLPLSRSALEKNKERERDISLVAGCRK